jgi:hypothetical protein
MIKEKQEKKKFRTIEEFIEGANTETTARRARKRPSKENLLLSIAGRGSMEDYDKPILIYIKRDIRQDIEKHCVGSKQGIINYLLRRGLDDLIKNKILVVEEQY